MKIPLVIRARKWSAAVLAVLFFAADRSPAQFLEVSVRVESVLWPSIPSLPQIEHRHTNNVRCVFGTNLWLIEGQFLLNAKETFWCTGTNIIKHTVITREHSEPAAAMLPMVRPLHVGEQFTSLIRPSERQPLEGIAHLAWLAFCSGPFLKSEGHRLTAPFPPENRKRYTDKTRLLAGPPDLPEQVEFYKTEGGSLLCAYYVLQSTNFYGWTVPVRFECEQYRDYGPDPGRLSRRVTATVTSIRQAPEPVLPAEVVRDLAQKNFD